MEVGLGARVDRCGTFAAFQRFRDTWLVPALCHRNSAVESASPLFSPHPPEKPVDKHRGRRPAPPRGNGTNAAVSAEVPTFVAVNEAAGSGAAAARTLL